MDRYHSRDKDVKSDRNEENIVKILRLGESKNENEFRGKTNNEEFLEDGSESDRPHEVKDGADGKDAEDSKGEVEGIIALGEFRSREPLELLSNEKERVYGEECR